MEPNVIRFENPEYLYLLLVIPLFLLLFWWVNWQNKKLLRQFARPALHKVLMPLSSARRRRLKFFLFSLAIASLIVALANPQTGAKLEEVKREGIDLFIAVDISNSMLAEDIVPNRLENAKQAINKLINKLEGDRIGIVLFAGKAYIQLPLTTDYAAARMFVSTIETNLINAQGTAIGEAISTATDAFDENEHNKAIIIISDGEDHEENPMDAVKQAIDKGITIYTIGMGLAEGAPIPIYNQYGKRTGFRKNKENSTIITRLNEPMLQQIAAAGGGNYVRANNSQSGLDAIFDEINQMEKSEIEAKVFTDYEDQFQWFLVLALILLVMEAGISSAKKQWEKWFNIFDRKESHV
ncbi:MAG: VWA domain-containing protein [Bacteroidales bacterium]|jgi:Ca-activated chloride channel family protein|nr:VWA domain-containing protein [Bacteroidales bacterium]MDN5348717.1 Ca-activated chloride channel [Bacteroidales bacterium]